MRLTATRKNGVLALCLSVGAFLYYASAGIDGFLPRDNGLLALQSVRILEGIPPYLSLFDVKGPMAQIVGAGFLAIARTLGVEFDIYSLRVGFWIVAALSVGSLFLLLRLFTNVLAAALGATSLLLFDLFTHHVVRGPRFKVLSNLFLIWFLYFTFQRRYYWAGLFLGCAALVWQPLALFIALPAVAILSEGKRKQRALFLVTGLATPLIGTLFYLLLAGALPAFVDAAFLHHLRWTVGRSDVPFTHYLFQYSRSSHIVILLGGLTLLVLSAQHLWQRRWSDTRVLSALGLLIILGWSAIDCNGWPDHYPTLLFLLIGWSLFLASVLPPSPKLIGFGISVFVAYVSLQHLIWQRDLNRGLGLSEARAQMNRAGLYHLKEKKDLRVFSLYTPQLLLMLNLRAYNTYKFFLPSLETRLEQSFSGGKLGYLKSELEKDPDVLLVKSGWLEKQADFPLDQYRKTLVVFQDWSRRPRRYSVWVKKEIMASLSEALPPHV